MGRTKIAAKNTDKQTKNLAKKAKLALQNKEQGEQKKRKFRFRPGTVALREIKQY